MSEQPRKILEVSQLRVTLDGRTILSDLSLELAIDETLVILGPNGAGKTVLLKALLGLIPHGGSVRWQAGVKIGYVPQRVPLNRELPVTVGDFFALKGLALEQAVEILAKVGITDPAFVGHQLGLLSSGQFQRVLIAWALKGDPDVIFFDEPTAGIDIGGEDTIHAFLHSVREKRRFAVVLVTHDLSTVYREATRVLCMNQRKIRYGTPEEILDPRILEEIYGRKLKFFEPPPNPRDLRG